MFNQNYPFSPNFITNLDSDSHVKLSEDQYEVYVNGDYVGSKSLQTQGEQLSDIDGFLRTQGLTGFSSLLDGSHYNIQTNEQAEDIMNALEVYFNNR